MKRFLLLSIMLLTSIGSILVFITIKKKSSRESLPNFSFQLIDSITVFNTKYIERGMPFVIMYFSPDCEHCQEQTEEILQNIIHFKNTKVYLLTSDPFERLKIFYNYYKLYNYQNIVLGRDFEFYIFRHFKPSSTPFIVIYDKVAKLSAVFIGGTKIQNIINTITDLR